MQNWAINLTSLKFLVGSAPCKMTDSASDIVPAIRNNPIMGVWTHINTTLTAAVRQAAVIKYCAVDIREAGVPSSMK